jgi:GNAT superfamily N-acetyltransferase
MTMPSIALARSDKDISACFAVMKQLRPQLISTHFVQQVREQEQYGYRLAYLQIDEKIVAVAGFRVSQCLAWGKFLYVDDLVTDADVRSRQYGAMLFQWLARFAQGEGCAQLHLDSGVQRFAAHRFYHRQCMRISSHHFILEL